MKNILEEVRDNGALNNKLLEILFNNKAHENEPVDRPRQLSFLKNTPLVGERLQLVQGEVGLARPKTIDLEKIYGEPSTSSDRVDRRTETTLVDSKKRAEVPKIHSSISGLCQKL